MIVLTVEMLTNLIFVLALCFGRGTLPQARSTPYDMDFGPGFHDVSLDRTYSATAEQIEAVDFRNLTLHVFTEHENLLMEAKLKNGWYECNRHCGGGVGYETVKLDSIHYLPSGDSRRQFAVVLYTWFAASGSSNTDGIAQVFELAGRQLSLKQQLEWDEHFRTGEPHVSFDQRSHVLVLRSAHYLPGDSHCCVSAMDIITLRWSGSRFDRVAVRTERSDYGAKADQRP